MLTWKQGGSLTEFRAEIPDGFIMIKYTPVYQSQEAWRVSVWNHNMMRYAPVDGYPTLDAAQWAAQGMVMTVGKVISRITLGGSHEPGD